VEVRESDIAGRQQWITYAVYALVAIGSTIGATLTSGAASIVLMVLAVAFGVITFWCVLIAGFFTWLSHQTKSGKFDQDPPN
jgi:fatty acid desaturase